MEMEMEIEIGSSRSINQRHWDWTEREYEDQKKKVRKISGFEESEGAWENNVVPLLRCVKEMGDHLRRRNGDVAKDLLKNKNNLVFVCSYVSPGSDPSQIESLFPDALRSACLDLYTYRDDFELVLVTKLTPPNDIDGVFTDLMIRFPLSSVVVPFQDSECRNFMCDFVLNPGVEQVGLAYKCLLVNIAEKSVSVGKPEPDDSLRLFLGHLKLLVHSGSSSFDYRRIFKTMWPLVSGSGSLSLKPPHHPPISRIFKGVKPVYCGAVIADFLKELPPIQIGQKFDVKPLLSARCSNELLLRRHGEQVELGKAIEGKYTMICCFHAPIFRSERDSAIVQSLVNTCSELYTRGMNFELVVVVKMKERADHKQVFDHFLSGFPSSCLVIPFEDSERRDFICKYLQLNDDVQCLLLDDNSNVLFHGYPEFALLYGADGFPYTKEELLKLEADEGLRWTTRSTNNLLSILRCKPSDVLKKTNDDSVMTTISDINKNDVVGLFLCVKGDLIPKLKEVYEECKIQNKPFEVLMAYIPFRSCLDPRDHKLCVDDLLQKHGLSLWYMPFDNSVSHKLYRLIGSTKTTDQLIIFRRKQGALSIAKYGKKMIRECGADGYPFIRKDLVECELARVSKLTLETLLVYKARDYVLQDNKQIPVADLKDRNILLWISSLGEMDLPFFEQLYIWYRWTKEKIPDFEVVFVLKDKSKVADDDRELSEYMPWLVCPFDADHSAFVWKQFYPNYFVEFGKGGRLVSFTAHYLLDIEVDGSGTIPFGRKDLRESIIRTYCARHGYRKDFMKPYYAAELECDLT